MPVLDPPTSLVKRNAASGDILAIDVPHLGCVIAKVLYTSRFFKDVMLNGTYGMRPGIHVAAIPTQSPSLLLYTATTCVRKQAHWNIIGTQDVSARERQLSQRIVAGEVWVEDTELRPATRTDRRCLPEMGVLGYLGVEQAIRQAFGPPQALSR